MHHLVWAPHSDRTPSQVLPPSSHPRRATPSHSTCRLLRSRTGRPCQAFAVTDHARSLTNASCHLPSSATLLSPERSPAAPVAARPCGGRGRESQWSSEATRSLIAPSSSTGLSASATGEELSSAKVLPSSSRGRPTRPVPQPSVRRRVLGVPRPASMPLRPATALHRCRLAVRHCRSCASHPALPQCRADLVAMADAPMAEGQQAPADVPPPQQQPVSVAPGEAVAAAAAAQGVSPAAPRKRELEGEGETIALKVTFGKQAVTTNRPLLSTVRGGRAGGGPVGVADGVAASGIPPAESVLESAPPCLPPVQVAELKADIAQHTGGWRPSGAYDMACPRGAAAVLRPGPGPLPSWPTHPHPPTPHFLPPSPHTFACRGAARKPEAAVQRGAEG